MVHKSLEFVQKIIPGIFKGVKPEKSPADKSTGQPIEDKPTLQKSCENPVFYLLTPNDTIRIDITNGLHFSYKHVPLNRS